MLSSSLVLGVYLTVQKRQKPSLYLKHKAFSADRVVQWRAAVTYSHVALQRPVAGHQHVQTQVELLPADQQRVVDVQRDDVGLLPTVCRHEPVKHQHIRQKQADDGTFTVVYLLLGMHRYEHLADTFIFESQ